MKVFVMNLKGGKFEIEVNPENTVADMKKTIESRKGADLYPAGRQMLIHKGKILKDGTTMEENEVAENSRIVVMLAKNKKAQVEGSTTSSARTVKAPQTSVAPTSTRQPPAAASDVYGQAASNLVAGNNLKGTIQHILDMGGGTWDRDTVVRALRAAHNNPEQAVEYLYSGIPESAEGTSTSDSGHSGQAANNMRARPQQAAQPARVPSTGPITMDLFPQRSPSMGSNAGGANSLGYLRNCPQFQAWRAAVQANPRMFQSMLRALRMKKPQLARLIQEHESDFFCLLNEPNEGRESNITGQVGGAFSQSLTFTRQEREAIERIQAMGFRRTTVLQAFLACNRNEELTANYLLDHMHEFRES